MRSAVVRFTKSITMQLPGEVPKKKASFGIEILESSRNSRAWRKADFCRRSTMNFAASSVSPGVCTKRDNSGAVFGLKPPVVQVENMGVLKSSSHIRGT